MVWTNAQLNNFFTAQDQMNLSAQMWAAIQTEGIDSVEILAEYNEDQLKTMAKNLRAPPAGGAVISIPALSLARLSNGPCQNLFINFGPSHQQREGREAKPCDFTHGRSCVCQ